MYRGTTPTITINCDIDVSEFVTMWVLGEDGGRRKEPDRQMVQNR